MTPDAAGDVHDGLRPGPARSASATASMQLLESYKAVNPAMIQLDSLDPYSDLTRGDELVKRVPELGILHGGGVVIEYGEGEGAQHVVVRNQDLFQPFPLDPARGGQDQFASAFTGEDEITSALIRLREGKKSKVAFTTGHGEAADERLEPARSGHRQLEGAARQGRLRGDRPQPDPGRDSPRT